VDNAYKSNLRELLGGRIRFVVPPFQRHYVWTADEWRQLWEDLRATADRTRGSQHFLGAVVLQHRPDGSPSGPRPLDVVDGQQRLVTLQLLLAAIRDIARGRGLTDVAAWAGELTVNRGDSGPKLTPALADRDAFGTAMTAGGSRSLQAAYAEGLPPIGQAYHFFVRQVTAFLKGTGKRAGDALNRLFDALGDDVYLVVMELGEDDDPQAIYERLNSGGAILRASELVRNHILHMCEREGLPQLQMYEDYWADFDDGYWFDSRTRQSPTRLDHLLRTYLIMETRADVPMPQLFSRFRTYTSSHRGRLQPALARVARYGQIFASIDTGAGLEPYENEFLARLRAIDSTVLTPVLLRLFGEYDARRRRPALAAIESYLLRRHVCGLAPRSHGDLVGPLLKQLVGAADPGTVVRDHLAARTGKSTWPSDDEVRKQARVRPIYFPGRGNGAVHLMLMLAEARLHGDAAPVLPAEKLTIEHLLPQSWREEGWPIDESTPRTMAQEQIDRAALMHTLGNLTLVTFEENQRLADKPWAEKITLLPSSPLRLNQHLPATFGSAASIRARGEFLADLICAALPGPDSAPVAVPKQRTSVAEPTVEPDPLVGFDDIDVDEAERADETDPSDASEQALDGDDVEEVTAARRRGYAAQIRAVLRAADGPLTYIEIAARAAAATPEGAVPANSVKYLLATWAVSGVHTTTKEGLRAGMLKPRRRQPATEP
jgi:Protein of unknown function DUF262/Protein of unknown function (DUF1524)